MPFAIVPLVHFVSNREKMGEFRIGLPFRILGWSVVALITGLNGWLAYVTMREWASHSAWAGAASGVLATVLVARDETGRPVAYNASYFFYWLDRKGWNIPREAISPDEVRAYARKGARFFVSEKDVLDAAPGLEARLRAAFPAAAECPAAILFRIEDSGPAPDRISK